MSEKTEAPTPQRLRRARAQGDVPVSAALGPAIAFVVALAVAPGALAALAARAAARLTGVLAGGPPPGTVPAWVIGDVLALTVPVLLATAAAGTAAGLVQTGGVVTLHKVAPDLTRIDPLTGVKNLVSGPRLLSLVRALIGALLVSWLATRALLTHGADLAHSVGNPSAVAALAGALAGQVAWLAALVGLALGAVDLLVTRYTWWRRLRMSPDEVKREHKESEGDPELKAARQRAHQEVLTGATLAAVRQATVVVVNPTHLASALRYDEAEDDAPRVLAQGRGELARRIIDEARAHGVPVVRDVPVAHALADLAEGERIPEALYEAVATILRELWEAEPGREQPSTSAATPASTAEVSPAPAPAVWPRRRA